MWVKAGTHENKHETGAGFLFGTWITSLLCVAPFLPPSQRGPENLSHWAANKVQRFLITHRESLEGNFSSSRPNGSSSNTGHQLFLFSCSGTQIEPALTNIYNITHKICPSLHDSSGSLPSTEQPPTSEEMINFALHHKTSKGFVIQGAE